MNGAAHGCDSIYWLRDQSRTGHVARQHSVHCCEAAMRLQPRRFQLSAESYPDLNAHGARKQRERAP